MAASVVDICNLALTHIGNSHNIVNIDDLDDVTKLCRRIYDQVRPELLRGYNWGFARKQVALALLRGDPSVEFAFAYAEPGQCQRTLGIVSGVSPETLESIIPYKTMNGTTGPEIWTNEPEAVMEYIHDVTNTALFPSDFAGALGWGVAVQMLPALSTTDKYKMTPMLDEKFNRALAKARSSDAGTEQDNVRPTPPSLAARG